MEPNSSIFCPPNLAQRPKMDKNHMLGPIFHHVLQIGAPWGNVWATGMSGSPCGSHLIHQISSPLVSIFKKPYFWGPKMVRFEGKSAIGANRLHQTKPNHTKRNHTIPYHTKPFHATPYHTRKFWWLAILPKSSIPAAILNPCGLSEMDKKITYGGKHLKNAILKGGWCPEYAIS